MKMEKSAQRLNTLEMLQQNAESQNEKMYVCIDSEEKTELGTIVMYYENVLTNVTRWGAYEIKKPLTTYWVKCVPTFTFNEAINKMIETCGTFLCIENGKRYVFKDGTMYRITPQGAVMPATLENSMIKSDWIRI